VVIFIFLLDDPSADEGLLQQLAPLVASCDLQFQPCVGILSVPLFVRELRKLIKWRAALVVGAAPVMASYLFPRT
jgi:hypothetical protein